MYLARGSGDGEACVSPEAWHPALAVWLHAGNEISGVISDGVRDSGLAMRDNQEEAPRPDRQEIQGSKYWVARGIGSDGCCITVLPDNGSAVTHVTVLLRVIVQEVTTIGEGVIA